MMTTKTLNYPAVLVALSRLVLVLLTITSVVLVSILLAYSSSTPSSVAVGLESYILVTCFITCAILAWSFYKEQTKQRQKAASVIFGVIWLVNGILSLFLALRLKQHSKGIALTLGIFSFVFSLSCGFGVYILNSQDSHSEPSAREILVEQPLRSAFNHSITDDDTELLAANSTELLQELPPPLLSSENPLSSTTFKSPIPSTFNYTFSSNSNSTRDHFSYSNELSERAGKLRAAESSRPTTPDSQRSGPSVYPASTDAIYQASSRWSVAESRKVQRENTSLYPQSIEAIYAGSSRAPSVALQNASGEDMSTLS